jgi:hypothetical protein
MEIGIGKRGEAGGGEGLGFAVDVAAQKEMSDAGGARGGGEGFVGFGQGFELLLELLEFGEERGVFAVYRGSWTGFE